MESDLIDRTLRRTSDAVTDADLLDNVKVDPQGRRQDLANPRPNSRAAMAALQARSLVSEVRAAAESGMWVSRVGLYVDSVSGDRVDQKSGG